MAIDIYIYIYIYIYIQTESKGAKFSFWKNRIRNVLGMELQPIFGIITTQLKPPSSSIKKLSKNEQEFNKNDSGEVMS